MAEFNLPDLFQKAFGYEMPDKFEIEEMPTRTNFSKIGQPYYQDDVLGREMFMPCRVNGYVLPFAVMGMSLRKKLVETEMPERAGSVTEIITTEDYVINVKGILISDDNEFPEDQMRDLRDIFKLNQSIEMRSVLTDMFLDADHTVILKSLSFPPIAAVQNARPFEMDFKSDNVYTLEVD